MYSFLYLSFSINIVFSYVDLSSTIMYIVFVDFNKSSLKKKYKIDGGLFIHSFLSAIGNITAYGNLARTLLAYVCGSRGNEIHLLFDPYQVSERKLRVADDRPFLITGPEQAPRQGSKTGSSRISKPVSPQRMESISLWSNPLKQDAHCVPWWKLSATHIQ